MSNADTGQLVVAIVPEYHPDDLVWIDNIRARHEPNYSLVGPHFALVFPGHTVSNDEFLAHVRKCVGYRSEFRFRLDRVEILSTSHDGATYVGLIPDEGFDEILELHDRLYSGVISEFLREDLPFKPHLTIGSFAERKDAVRLVDDLRKNEIDISGNVSELLILRLAEGELTTIETISLGEGE